MTDAGTDPLAWLRQAAAAAPPPARPPVRRTERTAAGHPMAWADDAACAGMDKGLFYPVHSSTDHAKNPLPAEFIDKVRPTCDACPVRADCLDWAIHHEPIGIWAATDPRQRRVMRKALGVTLPEEEPTPETEEPAA